MTPPTIAIIMAGGSGERFWPLSRKDRPKQLLCLTDPNKTMLECSIDSVKPLLPLKDIWISTNRALKSTILELFPDFSSEQILAEPFRRNTAGCLAFAMANILARYPETCDDIVMAMITADHRIGKPEQFQKTAQTAIAFARENEAMVLIGIKPTRPETGFGYIEIPESSPSSFRNDSMPVIPVKRFHEKPSEEQAKQYLRSESFFWNSGMFFWRVTTLMKSMKQRRPDFVDRINAMRDVLKKKDASAEELNSIFASMGNESIDKALIEKNDNVFMTEGNFDWDDVSTWEAFSRIFPSDPKGNVIVGKTYMLDCRNVTIFNDLDDKNVNVGILGMENVIVVTTSEGVLVCSKERGKDVKNLVSEIERDDTIES